MCCCCCLAWPGLALSGLPTRRTGILPFFFSFAPHCTAHRNNSSATATATAPPAHPQFSYFLWLGFSCLFYSFIHSFVHYTLLYSTRQSHSVKYVLYKSIIRMHSYITHSHPSLTSVTHITHITHITQTHSTPHPTPNPTQIIKIIKTI